MAYMRACFRSWPDRKPRQKDRLASNRAARLRSLLFLVSRQKLCALHSFHMELPFRLTWEQDSTCAGNFLAFEKLWRKPAAVKTMLFSRGNAALQNATTVLEGFRAPALKREVCCYLRGEALHVCILAYKNLPSSIVKQEFCNGSAASSSCSESLLEPI